MDVSLEAYTSTPIRSSLKVSEIDTHVNPDGVVYRDLVSGYPDKDLFATHIFETL